MLSSEDDDEISPCSIARTGAFLDLLSPWRIVISEMDFVSLFILLPFLWSSLPVPSSSL